MVPPSFLPKIEFGLMGGKNFHLQSQSFIGLRSPWKFEPYLSWANFRLIWGGCHPFFSKSLFTRPIITWSDNIYKYILNNWLPVNTLTSEVDVKRRSLQILTQLHSLQYFYNTDEDIEYLIGKNFQNIYSYQHET